RGIEFQQFAGVGAILLEEVGKLLGGGAVGLDELLLRKGGELRPANDRHDLGINPLDDVFRRCRRHREPPKIGPPGNPERPTSATVGTSGRRALRPELRGASTLSFFSSSCPAMLPTRILETSMVPAKSAAMISLPPL